MPHHPYNTRNRPRRYRSGPAELTYLTSGAHREGVPACEGRSELALQSENITTDFPVPTDTNPSTIRSQSPKSATTMTSPERKRMPQRGERRAPVFTGESEELPRFFDGVEVAAEEAGLRDKEMMIWACRYVQKLTDEETWKTAEAFESANGTWEEFKKEIYRMYPGCEGDKRYTRSDLLKLVEDWEDKGIDSKEDLGEFDRVFRRIARFLQTRNRISTGELERTYLAAFTGNVRIGIDNRLMIKYPDHDREEPYEISTIRECAEYVLTGSAYNPLLSTNSWLDRCKSRKV